MTVELLTLIALWCGGPTSHNIYGEGPTISVKEVNQCREDLRKCIVDEIHKQGIEYATLAQYEAAKVCTDKIPHPGKDN